MKKLIFTAILLINSLSPAADLNGYRGTPLLIPQVEENKLPYGYYFIIRSYRNITQLLVSEGKKIVLYTDRDNQKDSEIFVSAYLRNEEMHIKVPAMQQHEFNLTIERLIRSGDSSSTATISFPGCDKFIDEIKKGTKPEKNEGEYFIYIKDNGRKQSLMTINLIWKKLTLRNMLDPDKIPSSFYSIYIDESHDTGIIGIIREYSRMIKTGMNRGNTP